MIMGDHGPIIANRYNVLVAVITPNVIGCETFVPAIRKPDPKKRPDTLIISFTGGNHFVPVKFKVANNILPLPPLSPIFTSNHAISQDIKDSWLKLTQKRCDAWLRLFVAGEEEFKR
jgi:hypothetical protein